MARTTLPLLLLIQRGIVLKLCARAVNRSSITVPTDNPLQRSGHDKVHARDWCAGIGSAALRRTSGVLSSECSCCVFPARHTRIALGLPCMRPPEPLPPHDAP